MVLNLPFIEDSYYRMSASYSHHCLGHWILCRTNSSRSPTSADTIINPEAPLALRLSGQLLLGVVKVYSKKVGYLFQDCNDALVKVKQVNHALRIILCTCRILQQQSLLSPISTPKSFLPMHRPSNRRRWTCPKMAPLQHTQPSLCQITSTPWISCQQTLASKLFPLIILP